MEGLYGNLYVYIYVYGAGIGQAGFCTESLVTLCISGSADGVPDPRNYKYNFLACNSESLLGFPTIFEVGPIFFTECLQTHSISSGMRTARSFEAHSDWSSRRF